MVNQLIAIKKLLILLKIILNNIFPIQTSVGPGLAQNVFIKYRKAIARLKSCRPYDKTF